jgi:uncharacterized protein
VPEIPIRVTPKSSRTKVEWGESGLRVWVTAPPADGEANDALIEAVAKAVGIAPSRISIVRGHSSRDKTLSIVGLNSDEIRQKLS